LQDKVAISDSNYARGLKHLEYDHILGLETKFCNKTFIGGLTSSLGGIYSLAFTTMDRIHVVLEDRVHRPRQDSSCVALGQGQSILLLQRQGQDSNCTCDYIVLHERLVDNFGQDKGCFLLLACDFKYSTTHGREVIDHCPREVT
jgi:hypothetical protein